MARRVTVSLLAAVVLSLPAVAGGGPPGTWTRVHAGNAAAAEPGLARTPDGTLHLAWQRAATGGDELVHQAVSPAGALLGSPVVIARAWQRINPRVELVASGTTLRALWGGVKAPGDALSGVIVSSTSTNGGAAWSAPAAFSSSAGAATANGIGAVASGTSVAAAQGDSPDSPNAARVAAAAGDVRYEPSCCAALPELAADGVSGDLVLGWFSSARGTAGLWTQQLAGAGLVGARSPVPGSASADLSAARVPLQRTALSGRLGAPGVFIAYTAGHPTVSSVNLMRLGRTPLVVVRGSKLGTVGLAAGPEGRLWLFWSSGERYLAARSNRAATRFGSATRLDAPVPAGTTTALHGEGSAGPLDLVAHTGITGDAADWHTQVLPRLSLRLTTGIVRRQTKRGTVALRRITLRVTDAGDPVAGARVKVRGNAVVTNADGRATIVTRPQGVVATATATLRGYTPAGVRVRV